MEITEIMYDNYTLDSTGKGDLLHLSCAPILVMVDGKPTKTKVKIIGWRDVEIPRYDGNFDEIRLNMIDEFPPFQDYRIKKTAIFKPSNGPPVIHTWYISHFKHLWGVVGPECNNELKGYDPKIAAEKYRRWLVHKTIPDEIEKECREDRIRWGHESSINLDKYVV